MMGLDSRTNEAIAVAKKERSAGFSSVFQMGVGRGGLPELG
jgi:hypothetical protein